MQQAVHLLDTLSNQVALNLYSYAVVTHQRGWLEQRMHMDYDIWFIQEGKLLLTVAGQCYEAEAGQVVFFYPGLTYEMKVLTGVTRFLYLHFDLRLGEHLSVLDEIDCAGIFSLSDSCTDEVEKLFEACEMPVRQPLTSMLVKGAFLVVLRTILLEADRRYARFQAGMQRMPQLARLEEVFAYVYAHMDERLSVSVLARCAGMSEKYFISYFKRCAGVSPAAYVRQIRMNVAKSYLQKGVLSVSQIAQMVGYGDSSSFSKAFKRCMHVSPGDIRQDKER